MTSLLSRLRAAVAFDEDKIRAVYLEFWSRPNFRLMNGPDMAAARCAQHENARLQPILERLIACVSQVQMFAKDTDRFARNCEGDVDYFLFNFKDAREEMFDKLAALEAALPKEE